MKLLLILVGFFACMSVERVGFRKWSFVFHPGILFLVVIVALVCAGCGQKRWDEIEKESNKLRAESNKNTIEEVSAYRDSETGCEYVGNGGRGLTPRMAAGGKQICRKPSL